MKKEISDLLDVLKNNEKNDPTGKSPGLLKMISSHGQLLSILSDESATIAEKNLKVQEDVRELTQTLKSYTRWLIFLTVVMLFVGFAQIYLSFCQRDIGVKSLEVPPKSPVQSNQAK